MVELSALDVIEDELVVVFDELVDFRVLCPVQLDRLLTGTGVSVPAERREPEGQYLVDDFSFLFSDGLALVLESARSVALVRVPVGLDSCQAVEVLVLCDIVCG